MFKFLPFLLVAVTAYGQFGVQQPFFKRRSTATNPFPLPAYYWFVSDDNTNGVVNQWIDRVNGLMQTNLQIGELTAEQVKTASGTKFNWLSGLSNAATAQPIKGTYYVVQFPRTTGVNNPLFAERTSGNFKGCYLDQTSGSIIPKFWDGSAFSTFSAALPENEIMVLIWDGHVGSGGSGSTLYTNGVAALTATFDAYNPNCMGFDLSANHARGTVLEVAAYTTELTADNALSLYQYATNQYHSISNQVYGAEEPWFTNICSVSPLVWFDANRAINQIGAGVKYWISLGKDGVVEDFNSTQAKLVVAGINGFNFIAPLSGAIGAGQYFNPAPTFYSQPYWIFGVLQKTNSTAAQVAWNGAAVGQQAMLQFSSANNVLIYSGASLATTWTEDAGWHVWAAKYDGASSKIRLDGTTLITGNAGAQQIHGIMISENQGGGNNFLGNTASLMVFTDLPTGEETKVEAYLKARYGTP